MALTEKQVYQVEITENDNVQVRVKTNIYRDGEIIATNNERHVVAPGQDYSGEIGKVRRMCQAAFTPTVLDREEKREALALADTLGDIKDAETALKTAEQAHEAALIAEG